MDTDVSVQPRTDKATAFVDASVIAAYLAGQPASGHLFSDGYRDRVQFALDPVVMQEVLSLPQVQASPELLENVRDRLDFEILPLNLDRSERLLQRAKVLRNRIAHSSDILVAASAADCDYLITYDSTFRDLLEDTRTRVVTPEEFLSLMAPR